MPLRLRVLGILAMTLPAAPLSAADGETAPVFFHDLRLRYEYADIASLPKTSDALTARLRSGFEVGLADKFHLLVEGEGVLSLFGADQPRTGAQTDRPLQPDFEQVELNRLQLVTTIVPRMQITAGRQRIALDDMRFVANVPFRQSDLTFDAVRAQGRPIGPFQIDAAYLWQANRNFGVREFAGGLRTDSWLLNVSLPTPIGQLAAFHYDIDTDRIEDASPDQRFHARSTGARLEGRKHWDDAGVEWMVSAAAQYDGDTGDDTLWYRAADLKGHLGGVTAGVRAEVLGGNGTRAFQTPFALLHAFQGFADLFVWTPPDGVKDYSAQLTWRVGSWDNVRGLAAFVRAHRFEADRGSAHYGNEIDIGLSARLFEQVTLSLEYAHYEAQSFGADTDRLWISLSRSF